MLLLILGLMATHGVVFRPSASQAQDEHGSESAPPSERDGAYRALIRDAVAQSRAGRLQEALALFQQAHAIRPSARTLRGIGLVRFGLSDYAGTIDALQASLADERRPLEGHARQEAEELMAEARRYVAVVSLRMRPLDAQVRVDGAPADPSDGQLLLNPGRHQLRVSAEGYEEQVRSLTLEGGTETALVIELRLTTAQSNPETPPRTTLRIRSAQPNLILHAIPLGTDGEPVPNSVSEVCEAPCLGERPAGLYRLGVAHPTQAPVLVGDYRLEEALQVRVHYDGREGTRVAGWFVLSFGLAASVALFGAIAAVDSNTPELVLGITATTLAVGGLSIGLPLIFWGDGAGLELRPLEEQ